MSESIVEDKTRSAKMIVFFVVFIDLLGFGIVLPLLPQYADNYLKNYDDTMKGVIIGALMSSFSLMQFIFSPVWGRISDRIGRKPIILLSLMGSVVFYGLFGFASTLPPEQGTLAIILLLIARSGAGIAGASVSTAAAVIADTTTPEKRSKGMALIGAAFGIGFTFGPLIAVLGFELFQGEKWAPGVIASVLSAGALLLALLKLPETRKPNVESPAHRSAFSWHRTVEVLKMPTVGPLILIYFLAIMAFANFEATLALFLKVVFRFEEKNISWAFAGVGFVLLVAQGGFYRRFAGKMNEVSLMKAGLGMMFIGLGGLGAVAYARYLAGGDPEPFRVPFYLACAVAVFGFAFLNPSVAALVSRRSDPNRQGEVLGVNQSFAALGRIIGPFVGSMVFYWHESHVLPFAVASLLLILVVALISVASGKPEEKV